MKIRFISLIASLFFAICCFVVPIFAQSDMCMLEVDITNAMPGETVDVNIKISNNPGILGATLVVTYDEGLTLESASNGEVFSTLTLTTPSRYESGCQFIWYGSEIGEIIDGNILTLTFKVNENAESNNGLFVGVSYDSRDILDENYNEAELDSTNGEVYVIDYKPGDVSGDGRINPLDLIKLCQYISDGCITDPNGYNITINDSAADVNDDGRLNPLDLIFICRYISDGGITNPSGYNISLKPARPDCVHSLESFTAKSATCTEDGNIAYWMCSFCGKYYRDEDGTTEITFEDTVSSPTGHTEVVDEAVEATYDKTGLTEGIHCSVCDTVLVNQVSIPMLEPTYHSITYKNLQTAEYPSETQYAEHKGLIDLPVPVRTGYKFDGWYTASSGGDIVDYIKAGDTTDYVLFAHWSLEKYKIIYNDEAENGANPTEYTIENEIILNKPVWKGLRFTHWSDENGKTVTKIPKGTIGNIELTANWERERNIATPTTGDRELMVTYDENLKRYYFIYDLGTIEHVVLEEIEGANLWYNNNLNNNTFEWAETLTIEEGIADNIAKTISESVSTSIEWSEATEWATSHYQTVSSSLTAGIEVSKGIIKAKIEGTIGTEDTTEEGWSSTTETASTDTSTSGETNSVSSTVSYKNALTSSHSKSIEVSKDEPLGYYSYVHAGNIRVYAVVTYDPENGNYYLDTFSMLDNMHDILLYYRDVNELNNPSCGKLAFDIPTTEIENYFSSSLYNVKYDANGGEGEMPVSVFSNSMTQPLYKNQFTKEGYTFAGWELRTVTGSVKYGDEDRIFDLAQSGETVTLYAIWTPNAYTVNYNANSGNGAMLQSKLTYDVSYKLNDNQFTKTGYSFAGWNTASDGSGISYEDGESVVNLTPIPDGSVTLYAMWNVNTYSITFVTNGGSATQTQYYKYGAITYGPSYPTKPGNIFLGWSFDDDEGFAFGNIMPAYDIVATATWMSQTAYYDSGSSDKKIDASHEYDYDKFDISSLSPCMKTGYKFQFDVSVWMWEEDAGYQEIYLRNSNGATVGGVDFAHGGSGKDGGWWEYFTFVVDGEKCTNTMTLRYGAHGEGSDDWWRSHCKVTVTVMSE